MIRKGVGFDTSTSVVDASSEYSDLWAVGGGAGVGVARVYSFPIAAAVDVEPGRGRYPHTALTAPGPRSSHCL